jgi:hypothetical protein
LGGSHITSLFAHSGGKRYGLGLLGVPFEAVRFIHLLDRIVGMV